MNSRQKEVLQSHLNSEKDVIRKLKVSYGRAMAEVEAKIKEFSADIQLKKDALQSVTDASQRAILESEIQSKVYQKQYQEALKGQISAIFNNLQSKQYDTIKNYLDDSYTKGFCGTMYDLHGQGIPLILPIDQAQVVDALTMKTKLSKPLYQRLGVDIDSLKKTVNSEISRGIATGRTWSEIAQSIDRRKNINLYRASRIARTEGHRIQQQASFDAMKRAKSKGADIVKQWDSTLDDRTRPDHALLDGQIREVDEAFEVSGYKTMMPGQFGVASEDIHCRCVVLQRAKWALDDDELQTLKDRASYFNLDKAKNFEDFKDKYLKLPANADTMEITKEKSKAYKEIVDGLTNAKVAYNKVEKLQKILSSDEIIERLSGGDQTDGSCSSLAFSYIGNKNGLDVVDYRGGNSQKFFSRNGNIQKMLELPGVKGSITKVQKEAADTAKIISSLEYGKEYYIATGKHAAIVRNTEHGAEYLELQSKYKSRNRWTSFTEYGSTIKTLQKRFGCRKTIDKMNVFGQTIIFEKGVVLIEVDSFQGNTEFQEILGYINTAVDKQKKGAAGDVK